MTTFAGFPDGSLAATPIPDLFFTRLLPQIETLAELKVTLHVFWRTGAGQRSPGWLALDDLRRDGNLLDGLRLEPGGAPAAILEGLTRAVERGTLLRAVVRFGDRQTDVIAPNTGRGRRAIAALHTQAPPAPLVPASTPSSPSDRPRIFALYEENIGLVQPIIADELRAAAELYPESWVDDAFRQAAAYNRRRWSYVRRILERWATDGRESDGAPRGRAAGRPTAPAKRRWVQTYESGKRLPEV